MALNRPVYHTILEKLWPQVSDIEKQKLFEMLALLAIMLLASMLQFLLNLFNIGQSSCIICDFCLVIALFFAVGSTLKNKVNHVLNLTYTIPVFVYVYYISDFALHPQPANTVYQTTGLLLAGAFFLFYFSSTDRKIFLYSALAFVTILFQLLKAERFFGFFAGPNFIIPHPLVIYVVLFAAGYLVRKKYSIIANRLANDIRLLKQKQANLLRRSEFPIVEITAIRDEQGNVVNLVTEKINNTFESVFKMQLHEVKNQEANYVFNLALHEPFNLNNLLLYDTAKSREIYASAIEKWFKVHILKPDSNTFFVIFEDVTKIKLKVEELEYSRQRYKVLLEAIPDMFFVIGKDGTYEDFVVKESDLFKVEDANIIGSTIFEVGFPDNMAEKISHCIQNCLKQNSIEIIEYSLNTPNGPYMFEMRLAKLSDQSVISVSRDITRRKTAEFDLEKAKIRAEESDRLKSAFLANLSHEIRTPLNIITNFTRLLADGDLNYEERMEISDAISQNGNQLLNMIDNTIHLSKIETNSVELEMNFCAVNVFLRDVYNRYRAQIPEGREVKMKLNIDVPNSSFGFITDKRLLMESLQILIDNAVKYTLKGEVYVGYEMMRNELVKFVIADSGIGIPQEEMLNIFSRFYRVKNTINDMTSGSGIGLSIAQHYIQLLGGELQIESTPGKGTICWFTLPFREGKGYLRIIS